MINVDKKLHQFLTVLLYVVFATGYLLILLGNEDTKLIPIIVLTLIVGLSTYSHIKYYRFDAVDEKAKIYIIINMLLMFVFLYFNHTNFRQLFLLLLIGDCIFAFSKSFSIKYVIGTYLIYYPYLYIVYNNRIGWDYSTVFIDDVVISIFCIIILFIVKSQVIVNNKYNDLLIEQSKDYKQLEKYSIKIEDLAIAEERNRIALILHNSIGHSLTSIMLSLQAEKMELVSNNQIDKEAFAIVEKLIHEAMALLRRTIENADDFTLAMPFDEVMECFIREASNNTKVNISYDAKNTSYILDDQKSVILNVVTESITNAVKHSGCKQIQIFIHGFFNRIDIGVLDDGCGFDSIEYGFGITKSIQQVNQLGGHYEIISNSGCQINVFLPIEEVNTDA